MYLIEGARHLHLFQIKYFTVCNDFSGLNLLTMILSSIACGMSSWEQIYYSGCLPVEPGKCLAFM